MNAMTITGSWTKTLRTGRVVTEFCFATRAEGEAFAAWARSMVETKVERAKTNWTRVRVEAPKEV